MTGTSSDARPLTRRQVLKGIVVAGGATIAAGPARAAHPIRKEPHYGMVVDARRCIGCHACTVACKAEFDVPLGATRTWVEYVEKGEYPNVSRSFLPRFCNQCSVPQCVAVCPTGATYKRRADGIVVIDAGICIGCKYCVQACPYDMRFLNPVTGTADKCDFCGHRVSQGLLPACVEACEAKALIFGDLNDPQSEIFRTLAANPVSVLRPEIGTKPNVYYIDADHSDEKDIRFQGQYVRVTTHRKWEKRR